MNNRRIGMTTVELMVAMILLAILIDASLPSLKRTLEWNRASAVMHQLTTSLAAARINAVRSGQPVTVCPTRDALRCRRDLVWDDGWMIFLDPGRTGEPDSREALLEHVSAARTGLAIRSTTGRHRVRFQPSGWAAGANISLRVCTGDERLLLGTVLVNNAGRPRTVRRSPSSACR
jgi:type IV fimbrial biogenesis protein FimT